MIITVYTDPTAFNYDPLANTNQVSYTDITNPCTPIIYGCTDSTAFNYDPIANTDNGTCWLPSAANAPVKPYERIHAVKRKIDAKPAIFM